MKKSLLLSLLCCCAFSYAQSIPQLPTSSQTTNPSIGMQGMTPLAPPAEHMPKRKWNMTPEERQEHIQKMEQWCQNNKEKCEKRKEEMKIRMEKIKEWCKNNPNECAKKKEEFREKKEQQLLHKQQEAQQIKQVHDSK